MSNPEDIRKELLESLSVASALIPFVRGVEAPEDPFVKALVVARERAAVAAAAYAAAYARPAAAGGDGRNPQE